MTGFIQTHREGDAWPTNLERGAYAAYYVQGNHGDLRTQRTVTQGRIDHTVHLPWSARFPLGALDLR